MKKFLRLLPLAAAALAAAVAMAPAKRAFALDKLTVAHSIWVGYGPLYIARDKGYFKDEGLDVDLKVMDDTKLRMGALLAGQIDAAATSVDVALPFMTPTHQIRYLFALDDSRGGDGIVADKSIADAAGLKGKKVGFLQGSPSELLLATALKRAGLTLKDVNAIHMTAGDAGAAFLSGKIDAAVTWEPWLSRGKAAPNGHLLMDSTATPGLITDVLVATDKESKARQKDFQGFYRAWVKAVEFAKAHPDEANQIMAKGVGGWLKDPKAFADALSGVSLYGAAENKTYIGTAAAPGSITRIIQEAADLWAEEGNMRMKVEPAKTIDYSIVNP